MVSLQTSNVRHTHALLSFLIQARIHSFTCSDDITILMNVKTVH